MKLIVLLYCILAIANAQIDGFYSSLIVNHHNKLRMNVAKGAFYIQGQRQPSARNMRKLAWDTSLASAAQSYASLCPTGPSGATGYGENSLSTWTATPSAYIGQYAANAHFEWENQFYYYGLPSLTMDSTILASGVSDATQTIWAKSSLIGCGVANCGQDPSQANKTRIFTVCHYSTKGNILGEVIYESGLPCSNCPAGTACESDMGFSTGLCV